jgi:hypothetical protein
MVATLYLTQKADPGGKDWVHVYEIRNHTAAGITIVDGQNRTTFYPAHLIQRIEYK